MKTLLDRLDDLANNMGSAIYEDAETCGEAAAELRRLHEVSQKLQQQLGEAVWNYGEKVRANQELLEALKLALEGLEKWHFDKDPRGAADYIAAIRDALADSALDRMAENARELGLNYEPAQQQEPVALESVYETIIQWDEGGGKRSRRELARRIVDLYTSPPASKPWVGLSTVELDEIDAPIRERGHATIAEIYRAIEAKLREKNA